MGAVSIRVIGTPIHDVIVATVTGATAAIGVTVAKAGSAWKVAAVAVVTVTVVATAGVIRIDASVRRNGARMRFALKVKVLVVRDVAVRETVTAVMPPGSRGTAWKQAVAPVANPPAMTTLEIVWTQRPSAARVILAPRVKTAVESA
jgi:hypothetical protein